MSSDVNKHFAFSLLNWLKQRSSVNLFPIIFSLLSGFSVFYFLYFFEAYGIQRGLSYSGHSHLTRSVSFGVITFSYLATLEIWLKPLLKHTGFKYLVLWYVCLTLIGSQLIFLLFNFFWNWQEWNFEAYGLIMKEFPLMMVLPLSFYLVLKRTIGSKKPDACYLLFQSENGKDQLKIKLQDFLYASSSENYITISYIANTESKQHLIRKPLKVLEKELENQPEIEKPHRSYLINRGNIESVTQKKGKVYLQIMEATVPVSKQKQQHFLS